MKKVTIIIGLIIIILLIVPQTFSAPQFEVKDFKGLVGNIKIYLNGEEVPTKVEPFIIQDTGVTMVPLRDLVEALGISVNWDSNTRSIMISGTPVSKQASMDQFWLGQQKVKIENIKVIRNIGPFYQKKALAYQVAGRSFAAGVAAELDSTNKKAEVILDLNQKYSTFEGMFGIDDETMNSRGGYRLTIIADDRILFTSDILRPSEYPRLFEPGDLNLSYVNRLAFSVEWEEVSLGNYDRVVAALVDMNFYLKESPPVTQPATLPVTQPAGNKQAGGSETVIVQSGDTLFKIALKYNTTVDRLLILNPGLDRNFIMAGQKIRIPGR